MTVVLRSLAGLPAPELVQAGWRAYQGLALAVQTDVWNLVAGGIANPGDSGFQDRLRAVCEQHGVAEADLGPALQACGALLGHAAMLDLPESDFATDLLALSGDDTAGLEPIMPRYGALKTALRQTMLIGTLADHGKVLVALDWRVDRVASSNRVANIQTDVVFLTLKYREGESLQRITLQVTTEGLRDLRAFLDRFKE